MILLCDRLKKQRTFFGERFFVTFCDILSTLQLYPLVRARPDRRGRLLDGRREGSWDDTGQAEWLPVSDGKVMDREPRWSSNGNLLYFLSTRDGNHCIWAQRLEPTLMPTNECPSRIASDIT